MPLLFVCYPRCTTCQKARKWLDDHGIPYEFRDIKTDNPTEEELRRWHSLSGVQLKRFFNTSGQPYRTLSLKDRLQEMTENEQYKLLSTDGMLVKRPILASEGFVLVGFKAEEWENVLKRKS